ncbi:MAG: RNA polymerase sigma factor [Roseivirga sp.]|nr:RNA polymerase sigma factor [Roseivirga sp.]
MQEQNEDRLVKECLNGSRKAHSELYGLYKDKMFGICLRYASSEAEASDMLQEGFIKVFEGLHQFKQNSPLFYWVKRVVINAALGQLRKNKNRTEREEPLNDNVSQVKIEPEDSEGTDELLWLIQKLPTEYRTVFNLYTIEGYAHKEIAEMLNISEANSKVRLMRGRQILQQTLKKQMIA